MQINTFPLENSALYTRPREPSPMRNSWLKLFVAVWRAATVYEVAVIGDFTLLKDPLFPCSLSTVTFSAGGGLMSVTAAMGFTLCSCTSVFTAKQSRMQYVIVSKPTAWWVVYTPRKRKTLVFQKNIGLVQNINCKSILLQ